MKKKSDKVVAIVMFVMAAIFLALAIAIVWAKIDALNEAGLPWWLFMKRGIKI